MEALSQGRRGADISEGEPIYTERVAPLSLVKPHAQAPRQILNVLKGDAARARAAATRAGEPLERQRLVGDGQAVMRGVAPHHVEIVVLAAIVEADPQ